MLSHSIFSRCASRVGRLGGKQEILIGSAQAKCKVGNLIHELGHTLGFFHEHSRPDRDQFVKVAFELVKPGESCVNNTPTHRMPPPPDYIFSKISQYISSAYEQLPWIQFSRACKNR